MTSEEARELVEAMAAEYPAAYRLAKIVSLAVRIESELVRKARLTLLPEADAGAEADLWFSFLSQSQSPLAMTFLPEVTAVLRQKLAEDQPLLKDAWELLNEFHKDAPPALRLEEEVTWLALSGENNTELINQRLDSVIAAMLKDNRPGLVRWVNRAMPAMPAKARDSEAARILSLMAGAEEANVKLKLPKLAAGGSANELLSRIISSALPKVSVGVRLLTRDPESSPKPGMQLEFIYSAGFQTADMIEVPQTNPLLLEVSWKGEQDQHLQRVSLETGETRRIDVGSSEVSIRTALGDIHTLYPRFDYDFFLLYNLHDRDFAAALLERLTQEDYKEGKLRTYLPSILVDSAPSADTTLGLPFLTSRKVGLVLSPESGERDWRLIRQYAKKRPYSASVSDWLIPIYRRPGNIPPTLATKVSPIDFKTDADFEYGYQRLLSAITGRPRSAPKRRTKAPAKAVAPAVQSPSSSQGYLGMSLAAAQKTDFFTFFHLNEVARSNDSRVVRFKPTASKFSELVNVRTTLDPPDTIIQMDLFMARSFIDDPAEGLFAADMAKTLLGKSLPSSDQPDIESLAGEIRHLMRARAAVKKSPGLLTYLGEQPAHVQQFSSSRLRMENVNQEGQYWLRIQVSLKGAINDDILANPAIPRPPAVGLVTRRDKDGRDLLESLKEVLAPGRSQMVALWGAGGVGKTTLAAETARALSEPFAQRVVWVSADGRPGFAMSMLLDEIATQMEHPDIRQLAPLPKEEAVHSIIAGAPALIVLDNFETMTSESRERCLGFLTRLSGCSVLITTRGDLSDIRTVLNVVVPSMAEREAHELLDRMIAGSRSSPVRSLDRNVMIQAAEANPLLLQWVVTQLELSSDPRPVLPALAGGGKGDPAQRLFERAFNQSYLGEDGRATLVALSWFVPSAAPAHLAMVAGFGEDTRRLNDALARLAAFRFINPIVAGERLAVEGLTRELATARRSRDETAPATRVRFITIFVNYASADTQAPQYFEAERENISAARQQAFEIEGWDYVINIFESPFAHFLDERGYLDELLICGQQALTATQKLRHERDVASIMTRIADIHVRRREYDDAKKLNEQAAVLYKKFRDLGGLSGALHRLGLIARDLKRFEEAERHFRESLEISAKLRDNNGIAVNSDKLGSVMEALGKLGEAQLLYEQRFKINEEAASRQGMAISLCQMANVANQRGRKTEAAHFARQAIELYEGIESPDVEIARALLKEIEGQSSRPLPSKSDPPTPGARDSRKRSSQPRAKASTAGRTSKKRPKAKVVPQKTAAGKGRSSKVSARKKGGLRRTLKPGKYGERKLMKK